MGIKQKAFSIGTSAALLASLLATVVAPVASAAVVTGISNIGNVPVGGTSGLVTVSLHEQHVADLNQTGYLYIDLTNGTWTGAPVLSAAGTLGASASISGNRLSIKITGFDSLNTEDIVVTGLKVKATAAADITATLDDSLGGNAGLAGAFIPGTAKATGTLVSLITNLANINVTSVCGFDVSGNTATFGSQTGVSITGVSPASNSALFPGPQTVALSALLTGSHVPGEAVSQTVPNCSIGYPYPLGTVGTGKPSLAYGADPALKVFPGETNANASDLNFNEPAAGYLTDSPATTLTMTIATPGVTFSKLPTALIDCDNTNILFVGQLMWSNILDMWVPATQFGKAGTCSTAGLAPTRTSSPYIPNYQVAPPVMSADHKSISLTVDTASTFDITTGTNIGFYIEDIHYDVAASVPGGTFVEVDSALNNGLFVRPTANNNAVVFRGINATATPTTVLIGQNNQKSGAISFTENAAGFFTDISSLNTNSAMANMFSVCTDGPDSFDPGNPPYAKVTPGTGVLVLRDGAAASTTGLVAGTVEWNPFSHAWCYDWTVWTASTTASTITIGAKDMLSGALIDVPPYAVPGPVNMDLFIGHDAIDFSGAGDAVVTVANRVYASQVVVTALSQPVIAPGTGMGNAGDLQIAETGNGQLKLGEDICVQVMPRAGDTGHDVSLGEIHTALTPLATATGGLIVDRVSMWEGRNCDGSSHVGPNDIFAFHFHVLQQSTTGTGKIVISNIHYIVPADAVLGNVIVNVYGYGNWPTEVNFQSTVSNAKIGSPSAGAAASRLGATQTGAFTTPTKVAKVGKYVTFRFDFGIAAAGQNIGIWGATKTGNDWSAFTKVTGRTANASGVVYYYVRSSSATWKSFRANWVSGAVWGPSRQARWL